MPCRDLDRPSKVRGYLSRDIIECVDSTGGGFYLHGDLVEAKKPFCARLQWRILDGRLQGSRKCFATRTKAIQYARETARRIAQAYRNGAGR